MRAPDDATGREAALSIVLRRHLPTLVGLSALIVAQPLLTVYGANPAAITATKLSPVEFVLFGLAIVLVPPAVAALVEVACVTIAPRWLTASHRLTVGVFGLLLGFFVARESGLGAVVPSAILAAVAAVGLAALVVDVRGVATATRYCALVAPLALGLLLLSPAGAAAFAGGAAPADLSLDDPESVVLIVLDEFHLASIVGADGEINGARFPNFARLGASSTWYRNATSPLARTPEAVPAILSGVMPEGGARAPVAADFDRTLLTMLGRTHDVRMYEPVTDLCAEPCRPLVAQPDFDLARLRSLLDDASVVYRHQVLPDRLAESLPPTSARLAGFGDDAAIAPDLVKHHAQGAEADPGTQATRFTQFVDELGDGDTPEAVVHHSLLPHRPWRLLEDGRRHATVADDPSDVPPGDAAAVRHAHQRHTQQLERLDDLIGELLDRFDQEDRWEDTVLVVTADHGLNLAVDRPYREPGGRTDIDLYRVPLFVHRPGVPEGQIDDCPVTTLDVLPTVAEFLGADPGWSYDGSPLDECIAGQGRIGRVRVDEAEETRLPDSVDDLLERAAELASWYAGPGRAALYAVGEHGDQVGRAIDEMALEVDPQSWVLDQRADLAAPGTRSDTVPATLTGRIEGAAPGEAPVVIDGRVAGVVVIRSGGAFRGLVDPAVLTPGAHEVGLLIPDGAGAWIDPGPPAH